MFSLTLIYYLEVISLSRGWSFKNMFCTLSLNDQGFNIFSGDLYIDALILELF